MRQQQRNRGLPGARGPACCLSTEPICRSWLGGRGCRQLTLIEVRRSFVKGAVIPTASSENSLGVSRYDGKIGCAETVAPGRCVLLGRKPTVQPSLRGPFGPAMLTSWGLDDIKLNVAPRVENA